MPDTHVTIVGNLTDDPEVTFTPNGAAVCNFRLAVTARIKDGDTWRDGDTSFYRITAWRHSWWRPAERRWASRLASLAVGGGALLLEEDPGPGAGDAQ